MQYGAVCLIAMIFLPETWRKERSITYAIALKRTEGQKAGVEISENKVDFDKFSPGTTYVSTPAQIEEGLDLSHKAPTFAALKSVLSRKLVETKLVRVSFKDANVRQSSTLSV